MIINIRGNNGSGKSALVRKVLTSYSTIPQYGLLVLKRPEAYRVDLPSPQPNLFVLGPYLTPTGGADVITGYGMGTITRLLDKYSAKGHVLFESVVISTFVGAVGDWLVAHKEKAIVALLDTPLMVCLESVGERTGADARTKNIAKKVDSITSSCLRLAERGVRVETITRENGFARIREWLNI